MLLFAYDQDCESAIGDRVVRLLRRVRGSCYGDGGSRKKDFASLVVGAHCLGALLRLNRIEREKLRGRRLLNDGDISFSVGDEGKSIRRVPAGCVCAGAGSKAGEHFRCCNIEHLRRLVLSADKDAIVLLVDGKSGWSGDANQLDMAPYFEGLRIEGADLVLVFESDMDKAVHANAGSFAVISDRDRSHKFSLGSVDDGDIVGAVIVGEDTIGTRVVDAVRPFADHIAAVVAGHAGGEPCGVAQRYRRGEPLFCMGVQNFHFDIGKQDIGRQLGSVTTQQGAST